MVGIEAYRRSMTELARLRDDTGFRLLMLCHLRCPDEVKSIAADLGEPYAEDYAAMEIQLRSLGKSMDDHYGGSELTVSDEDRHPSRLGHRVIADLLYAQLEERGLLDELAARRPGRRP
jgi:hypothetical protein